MKTAEQAKLGYFRSIFWPFYRSELKLVIPMLLILFLTCFNYSILRNLKDVLVVTAKSSGGAVIPFIKVWAMLPMAVLSAYAFTKLSNRFSQEKVYYIMVWGFLIAYGIFGFILYPMRERLELVGFARFLETILPSGAQGFISMIRHWSFTMFYVMCELWSSIVLTVLFWGFANEITKVKDARRYYSIFSVVSSFSAVIAGLSGRYFSSLEYNPSLPFGSDAFEQTIMEVVLAVCIVGLCIMGVFWWLNRHVLNSPDYIDLHRSNHAIRIKKKQSLRDSFSFLAKSKYLICIAIIVVAYNLTINLVEVVWKDQLKNLYPNRDDYFIYLSNVTILLGIVSSAASFFIGKVIGRAGWTKTAMITPFVLLVTSLGFFGFLFYRQFMVDTTLYFMGMTPLAMAVMFGGAQNCLCKSAKYSVFDSTKEMAFIPLDHETKLKGKAAIDGVGSRLGKSGGAVIHQALLLIFSSLTQSAPYVAGILMGVIFVWFGAVKVLGVEFAKMAIEKNDTAEGITDRIEPEAEVQLAKT
jgi:ATP:ADP antiporter, AAA family